jgi:N-acetylneuraminic acid mutarotase
MPLKKKVQKLVILLALSLSLLAILVSIANATGDSWTTLEPMPTSRDGFGIAVVAGKIYAIGGYSGSYGNPLGTNEMYDPETDSWTTKRPMPTPRFGFGIAVYRDKIYAIGGDVGENILGTVNEVYDPATDTWETKTGLPEMRSLLCANVVNDKIYLIGGLQTPFQPWVCSKDNFVYDPAEGSWTSAAPIPTEISSYASAVVDNKIYVIGGYDIATLVKYNSTQIYDTETDTWGFGTPLPATLYDASAGATTGVLAPKRIYVLGGTSSAGNDLNQVYDPETDSWSAGTPMPTPRARLTVAVVDDMLYAIGGRSAGNWLAVNEQYTPIDYIPEFPSWVILPLFVIATLLVVLCRDKLSGRKFR